MILITEFARTIENILNGVNIAEPRPLDFKFRVQTDGAYLDHIEDKQNGCNFIPVFVSQLGGQYNPIPNIKMSTQTFSVSIYFPIKYKNQFFDFNDYLVSQFVGKIIDYGSVSGRALTNIDPSVVGEIKKTDFAQFKEWFNGVFREEQLKEEVYMSMGFKVYVTAIGSAFALGNCVSCGLSFQLTHHSIAVKVEDDDHNELIYLRDTNHDYFNEDTQVQWYAWKRLDKTLTAYPEIIYSEYDIPSYEEQFYIKDNEGVLEAYDLWSIVYYADYTWQVTYSQDSLTWGQAGTGASVSPATQQLVGDSYAKNKFNIANYNKSILVYVEDNDMFLKLLDLYNTNSLEKIENLTFTKTYEFMNGKTLSYSTNQMTLSLNENIAKGYPLTFTLTFGDR